MDIILYLASIIGIIGLTFLIFLSFGGRRKNLIFTAEEKKDWNSRISNNLSKWFTSTNIIGTLTTLATTYLFFIGNSKPFGYFILASVLTIWLSAYVTNYFTKKILSKSNLKKRIVENDIKIGIIASIFWDNDNNSRRVSKFVKYISIINITAIIWLEFSLFTDISSSILSFQNEYINLTLLFILTFTIFYFTIKYGLRGFVFADAFHSPIIGLSAIILCIGAIYLLTTGVETINLKELVKPLLPTSNGIIFIFHVMFINLFLILVTEAHWLRLWIFGENETKMQVKSLGSTAIIWLLLIVIGFATYLISGGQFGNEAITSLFVKLNDVSPIFLVAFWIGGMAALFSTADTQIYSGLLVNQFNSKTGQLDQRKLSDIKPIKSGIIFSVVFCIVYFLVRKYEIPFEKLIFILVPLSITILPAIIRASKGYPQKSWLLILSLILYISLSIVGLFQPNDVMFYSLLAALAPVLVSLIALKK